jgi:hypothetical protein
MMDNADYINQVRELILTHRKPSYQTTNRKEVRVICPYCNDGKHKDAGKLYISMTPPFKFHCFRCETSGVLNSETLRDLEIYDNELNMSLIGANKNYKATQGISKISFKKRNLKNIAYDTENSANACAYLNNRYGTNYSNEFLVEKFKAITDPVEFFKENAIYVNNNQFDYANSIGFISSDSSHLIFRDITNLQKNRYNNICLCPEEQLTTISKAYNISGDIDIMAEEINLVITEGTFDIIGVYNITPDAEKENTIFAAACGKAYNAVILNYIRKGFLNMNITIYSDGDVPIDFYKSLKASSPYLKNSRITVYYNSLYNPTTKIGKDFGVRPDQIKLKKIII